MRTFTENSHEYVLINELERVENATKWLYLDGQRKQTSSPEPDKLLYSLLGFYPFISDSPNLFRIIATLEMNFEMGGFR
jgi:hypothetical protein